MSSTLFLTVRFHDGRYHGAPDWPPSPARVFQALVAAASRGATVPDDAKVAFTWLESLEAPIIAAPVARVAKAFTNYVPNNDLDAVGGDVKRIGEIRAGKTIRPRLFDAETPLLYAWIFEQSDAAKANAAKICTVAEELYQLGRGVDMAWATCEILTTEDCDDRLAAHQGPVHRPSKRAGGSPFACPQRGSLASLVERYKASSHRFTDQRALAPPKKQPNKSKVVGQVFSQPPKPRFRQVAYDCPPTLLLFDLSGSRAPWPFARPVELVTLVRDHAAKRLCDATPGKQGYIERVFVGAKDSNGADKAARIRIVPLPSIGHPHADRAIRRVSIEIPPNCPIPVGDIEWAFSGSTPVVDDKTGEILLELIPAANRKMLEHYGVENCKPARAWRTVTPAALPATRRRIDPKRIREEAKGGTERAREEANAAAAAVQALRHAGISVPIDAIRVQREPFDSKGARAEAFVVAPRFPKERLWHAEVSFAEPQHGPLVIGDGRNLGLGLMAPVKRAYRDVFIFDIDESNRPPLGREAEFLRAVRRALMALDRDHGNSENVSVLFSGHDADGSPDRRAGSHRHIFLAATGDEGRLSTLYVFSPQKADRNAKLNPQSNRRFDEVVSQLEAVRAGELGVVNLRAQARRNTDDPVLARARIWTSATPYKPTRHEKRKSELETALIRDVQEECFRRGFPKPHATVIDTSLGPRSGVSATIDIAFSTAVQGPIILGRCAHFGLGLFKAIDRA